MSRLPPQPGELVERGTQVAFTFDGREVRGLEGDTIGSALYASGQRTFSRSFKYHRRRGLLCCAGQCPNCLVTVDDAPGVRACTEPLREGMRVVHQNALPRLELDVMRATDLVGAPFMPVGFYYRTFIRPRRLWPLYEKVLRNVAGLGRLRAKQADREWRTEYRRRHADVLVVGAGAAGLRAAIAAAQLGADVVLCDEGPLPGGRLLAEGGGDLAAELARHARAAGVELLESATALGAFDGLVPIWQGDTLHQVRARRQVLATGAVEQPLVFEGNDLPGVMLSSGALRLAALYSIRPGERAVVATTNERGLQAAGALLDAGVEVVAVADLRPAAKTQPTALRGAQILHGATVLQALGRGHVSGAVVGRPDGGDQQTFECDLLVVSGGFAPSTALLSQVGGRTAYDPAAGHVGVAEVPDGVYVAGELAGSGRPGSAGPSGELAGIEAALALGYGDESAHARIVGLRGELDADRERNHHAVAAPARIADGKGRSFACLCEDVTVKDIDRSIAEGFDAMELCKRYTTVTMGPCQGRMCQLASIRLMAGGTGQSLEAVGSTTSRPPWSAVPMGVLAGRPFEPAKRSALHGRHRELGATVMWAGDWRRAYDYGDPAAEAAAVHESAGLIDVSTLGKLLVEGPDAGAFLDRVYPNRLSNLAPGRVRYGVLCSDAGRIMDDGTVCRLDDESFYVTTTSSGAGAVEEWFSWWLADWRMDVRMTDVTQGLAAMNLAGPRSRELLAEHADIDCSADAFKYLDGREATVAGVRCLILRIGFVGELGYEIHCPAPQAEHLWDVFAGAGARPFGLEPQRVLRLQKMHVLIGQDTDSESTPYGAAMPWIVKLDKEGDFVGRWALEHAGERELQTALVGFTVADGTAPREGAAVLDAAGAPAGRVTSSRWSGQLGTAIGLAWVPSPLAHEGAELTISDAGRSVRGSVTTRPFFDPDGEVLRS
jgi:sarcosine oxidase subunit alpha